MRPNSIGLRWLTLILAVLVQVVQAHNELALSSPSIVVDDAACQAGLQALGSCSLRLVAQTACSEPALLNISYIQKVLGCPHGDMIACRLKCLDTLGSFGLPISGADGDCTVQEQLMKQFSGTPDIVVDFLKDKESGLPHPQLLPSVLADLSGFPSLSFLGEYQRCVYDVKMQYCLVEGELALQGTKLPALMGVCRPSTCSADSIHDDVGAQVEKLGIGNFRTTCHHIHDPVPEIGWTAGQIAALVLFVFIFLCLVAGSVYFTVSQKEAADTHSRGGWQGHLASFLSAWSVQRNLKSFARLRKEDTDVTLSVLDGVRVLSTLWVILGHTVIWPLMSIGYENSGMILPPNGRLTEFWFQIVPGGYFAVDTFFLLSGLLGARTLHAKVKKNPSLLSPANFCMKLYPMGLLGRWLRLTLVYAFVLIFSNTWYREIGRGGLLWNANTSMQAGMGCVFSVDSPDCSKYWWASLLYINNLINSGCLAWTWYLACDMQMFLILPFLVLIRERMGRLLGWVVLAAGTVGSMAWAYFVIYTNKLVSDPVLGDFGKNPASHGNYMQDVYEVSWIRVQPYLIGVGAAWLLENILEQRARSAREAVVSESSEIQGTVSEMGAIAGLAPLPLLGEARTRPERSFGQKAARFAGASVIQLISIALMASVVFLPVGRYQCKDFQSCANVDLAPWSPVANALYGATNHTIWGLGLAIFLMLCFLKAPSTGWANWCLGANFWQPLVKLTYSAYLLHPLVLVYFYCQNVKAMPYLDTALLSNFIAFSTVVFFFAFLVWAFVEKPCANLSAQFMGSLTGSKG